MTAALKTPDVIPNKPSVTKDKSLDFEQSAIALSSSANPA